MLTLFAATALSAFVVDGDLGGIMDVYHQQAVYMHGEKVIIDGACFSACTLFLRTDYDLDVCVTDAALLGFHKPYRVLIGTGIPVVTPEARVRADDKWYDEFYSKMPEGIQMLLYNQHIPSVSDGAEPSEFYYIKARDLHGAIPSCDPDWQLKYTPLAIPEPTTLGPQ